MLRNFLISTTAKDLSLMVSMQLRPRRSSLTAAACGIDGPGASVDSRWTQVPLHDLPPPLRVALTGARAAADQRGGSSDARVSSVSAAGACISGSSDDLALWYSVSALDVDPKRLDRVPHYLRLDADIASNFTRLVHERAVGRDSGSEAATAAATSAKAWA